MIVNPDPTEYRDIHGRQIYVGDRLLATHFTAARRRKVWLYFVVDRREASKTPVAFTVDRKSWFHLSVVVAGEAEIIDGPNIYVRPDGEKSKFTTLIYWWERPKVKQEVEA